MANLTLDQALQLAIDHHLAGRVAQAQQTCRQILVYDPNHADALHYLGMLAAQSQKNDIALDLLGRAIAARPDFPEAYCNLGSALKQSGRLHEGIAAYRRALTLNPNLAEAHTALGNALMENGELDPAIEAHCNALAINPGLPHAALNLANALKDAGRLDEAIAAYRDTISRHRGFSLAHGNLIYAMQFHPDCDARAMANEQRLWNQLYARPLAQATAHPTNRDPGRQLRIGYVSPDFRDHVVGFNLLPLFQHHDRGQFHLTCYSQVLHPDAITHRFKGHAAAWRDIVGLADEAVARLVRDDRIDILVDLTLHMANNRLLVFARKPAPIQITFAGYPGSTGLEAIDYRFSDPYLDPPGIDETIYSEKTVRLPNSFWCYQPIDGDDLPVNRLPALDTGVVTFGCLNNRCKINEHILAIWAEVLGSVEKSRLLLLAPPGSARQLIWDFLRQCSINSERVEFAPHLPHREYLELYHRIDIGLDSFPYNGHSTSLDSLWMGVPVVTLRGETVVSRAGWSQLSNLALTELAAANPGQFIQIAVNLSRDLSRLSDLRSTLRRRMETSPLMDAERFTRGIESEYRRLWRAEGLPHIRLPDKIL